MAENEIPASEPGDESAPSDAAAGRDGAATRIGELEAEIARLKDQLLRALAEQENIRRRGVKEREDSLRYATAGMAKDLLSVADNLRRALDSVPEAVASGAQVPGDTVRNLLAGVAATERELSQAFERNGIRRLDPMGEKFDHNLHQAIVELEHTGQPAGTVVQVLQAGYQLHDRLLREAMVSVAKGGSKAAETAAPDGEAARPEAPAEPETIRRVDTRA